jgi:hypothetical protein
MPLLMLIILLLSGALVSSLYHGLLCSIKKILAYPLTGTTAHGLLPLQLLVSSLCDRINGSTMEKLKSPTQQVGVDRQDSRYLQLQASAGGQRSLRRHARVTPSRE